MCSIERDIERWLRDQIKKRGGFFYKWANSGTDGVPDRIVILPGGRVIFVELKDIHGRVSPIQQFTLDALKRKGCDARVIRGREEAEAFIHEIFTT